MEKYGFTNNRQEINKKEVREIHKNWRNCTNYWFIAQDDDKKTGKREKNILLCPIACAKLKPSYLGRMPVY